MREAASLFAGFLAEGGDELEEHLDRVVALAEELAELDHLDEAAAILNAAVVYARASLSNDVDERPFGSSSSTSLSTSHDAGSAHEPHCSKQ